MLNRVFFDMKWTSHLRQIRILFIIIAMMIALASLVVSHLLVSDLAKEETARMEVWAEAMRSLNAADEHTDLSESNQRKSYHSSNSHDPSGDDSNLSECGFERKNAQRQP